MSTDLPLDQLLEKLKHHIEEEITDYEFSAWTVNAAGGFDVSEYLRKFSLEDLQDMKSEISEGKETCIKIDVGDVLLDELEQVITEKERDQEEEEEQEEDEYLDDLFDEDEE
jgi:hypothetical protein